MAGNPGTSASETPDSLTSLLECKESMDSWSDDLDSPTTSQPQRNIGIRIQEPSLNRNRPESWLNFPMLSEERVREMVEKESEHLPRYDYLYRLQSGELNMKARNEAIDWISKACTYMGFGPFCHCLSINYFDRFLSAKTFPENPTTGPTLSALCCLLLAAKGEETKKLRVRDFQLIPSNHQFNAFSIRGMEKTVLDTLKWRMQPITPCSYIDYFLSKINDDQCPSKPSISGAIGLILRSIQGVNFLQCRPSEIAAAVALYVSGERQAASNINKAMPGFEQEVKRRVLNCLVMMKALESHSDSDSDSDSDDDDDNDDDDDDDDEQPENSDEGFDHSFLNHKSERL